MVRVTRTGLAALYAVCLSLPAMAQQGVGAIGGTVMDDSGGVLPGVTVTLSSPGIMRASPSREPHRCWTRHRRCIRPS